MNDLPAVSYTHLDVYKRQDGERIMKLLRNKEIRRSVLSCVLYSLLLYVLSLLWNIPILLLLFFQAGGFLAIFLWYQKQRYAHIDVYKRQGERSYLLSYFRRYLCISFLFES